MRRSPTPRPWRPDFRGTTGVSLSSPSYLVRKYSALLIAVCFIFAACKHSAGTVKEQDSSGFVAITDVVPDVILEIRYYGTYNFVGTRIDGYLAPTALLTSQAADSLKAVSDDVISLGYRLKIYDAYRPQMGVDHFVRWAALRLSAARRVSRAVGARYPSMRLPTKLYVP